MKVLFVCVHNSGRSQMAEAFAKRLGKGVIEARSAGAQPADRLNPTVVQAMKEIGYEMRGQRPKALTREMQAWADRVVTMGCAAGAESEGAACPLFLGPMEDWSLEDPNGRPIEEVRHIRDEVQRRVASLVKQTTERQKR